MIIRTDRLITIDEAAYYLYVSPRTIYRKIYNRELLAYKVGGLENGTLRGKKVRKKA